jgi:hypothetical protein
VLSKQVTTQISYKASDIVNPIVNCIRIQRNKYPDCVSIDVPHYLDLVVPLAWILLINT